MERLTVRCGDFIYLRKNATAYIPSGPKDEPLCNALKRLADYEDTGVSPEGIKRLASCIVRIIDGALVKLEERMG